jgi:hypothetical protein
MSPFQKLIQGGYSESLTPNNPLPRIGGRCSVKRARPPVQPGDRNLGEEPLAPDGAGPPGRGLGKSTEGPA